MTDQRSKVWKFRIPEPDGVGLSTIEMPEGAVVLSVAVIGTDLFIYAGCDPGRPSEPRRLRVVPTGASFERTGRFVGTAVVPSPGLVTVWHVWET